MQKKIISVIALFLLLSANAVTIGATEIIATIKPLHSLVAGVIGDTGKVQLLLNNNVSPHDFQLKPSQLKSMQEARIIFSIDDSIETFLPPIYEILPKDIRKISVARESGIMLIPYREKDSHNIDTYKEHRHAHEEHRHAHEEHRHAHEEQRPTRKEHQHLHGDYDMHVWLAPNNAKQIVALIADELTAIYPDNRNIYTSNAQKLIDNISTLDTKLRSYLQPVRNKPFITFHDAYQYLEHAYGLNYIGSITIDPNVPLSPTRIQAIRAKLRQTGAVCIFKEPQFSDRPIKTVGENFDIKIATLDPLGTQFPADEDLYFKLMNDLALNLRQCLE